MIGIFAVTDMMLVWNAVSDHNVLLDSKLYLYLIIFPVYCHTGEIRLQGSMFQYRGRVKVCANGVWGTVCDDSWDSTDSSVVCKQLGYSRFGTKLHKDTYNMML